MELLFSEVAASGDGEYGKQDIRGVIIEHVLLVIIIVLQVDAALEGDSGIRLNSKKVTSTTMKVSSHLLICW